MSLEPALAALLDEATTEIARFDGRAIGAATSFAALLLRLEAASSSQIEDLTSSAKAVALAELGRPGRTIADEIVGNVTAMVQAIGVDGDLDSAEILRMHGALMIVAYRRETRFESSPKLPRRSSLRSPTRTR